MKLKSKLTVLLLTLALLCGAFAFLVSAEASTVTVSTADFAEKWNAAEDGATLTLSENITYAGETLNLAAGKTLTLDLGGHTLTAGDAALFTSAGNLTLKNGKITVGTGIAITTTGGKLNLTDLTVTTTATDDTAPAAIVKVTATETNLSDVIVSGKTLNALWIQKGSVVTAVNATIRNTVTPIASSNVRPAVLVEGNNTVSMTDSLIEAVYTGIRFVNSSNDAAKNTFLFKNSTLNVTFKNNIDGKDLVSDYNAGNIYKVIFETAAHTTLTFDGSRVTGVISGKGFGTSGSSSDTKAYVILRDCRLYMGSWGRETYTTLEGTNFFFGSSEAAYNAKVFVRCAEGSRSYFTGTIPASQINSNTDYPLPSLVTLDPFYVNSDCGNQFVAQSTIKSAILAPDETITREEALAEVETLPDVSSKVYTAAGELYGVSFGGSIGTVIPAGGTLRLVRDVTIAPLNGTVLAFTNNIHFDLNGYWLSLGGKAALLKNAPFSVSGEAYVYTSREGGGIRFLSVNGGTTSFAPSTDSTQKNGSYRLFELKTEAAHLHLGYTDNAEGTDYRETGFTVISSCIVQIESGKLTVKGGNYYRVFNDNSAFFDIRSNPTTENKDTVTAEDAYFYSYGTYAIVTTHNNTTFSDLDITMKNCVIDNSRIYSNDQGKLSNIRLTLTDCVITMPQEATPDGVTVDLGDGCRYIDTVSIPSAMFGSHTYDVVTDSYTLSRRNVRLLTAAQAEGGESSFTGVTSVVLNRKVTEEYVLVRVGDVTSKWELGATVTAEGASYRNGGTVYVAKGIVLKNGDTVYADAKIPTDLAVGTQLVAESEYEEKALAFLFIADTGAETYYFPGEDDAADGYTLMQKIQNLTASTDVVLYKDVALAQDVKVDLGNMKGKTLNFDLNGNTFTVKSNCAQNLTLFIINGATMHFYSSLPGGRIQGPGANRKIVSVNSGGTATLGAYGNASGDNFSTEDIVVGDVWSNHLSIDGGTYSRTGGSIARLFDLQTDTLFTIRNATIVVNLSSDPNSDNSGIFYIAQYGENNKKVTLENCNVYTNKEGVNLFKASAAINSVTATITGGNYYGITLREKVDAVTTLTYNISASPKFSAVEEGALSGKTLVTIDPVYFDGNTNSPVSCVLADSEEGTCLVTLRYGDKTETKRRFTGTLPEYRRDAFGTYYWYVKAAEALSADTELVAKLKTTESKISGNLTLYADITFNLYFKADGFIKGVTYNGTTVTFTDDDLTEIGGVSYYRFTISDIAPKDLSKAFRLDVVLENEGAEETYSVMTSLVKYAASVLASEETDNVSEAGKTLVLSLLDYVRETSVALGDVALDSEGIRAIDACLAKYSYERKTWTKPEDVTLPSAGDITGASLHLVSDPGFIFYLDAAKYAQADTVTVTVNGVTKSYTVKHATVDGEEKYYITVDNIHISNYRADLKVTLGEQTFIYNFDMYMIGFGEDVPSYANALYSYSLAAEAYLAAQVGTR